MGHSSLKRVLVYLVLLVALGIGYRWFTDLPVTRVALEDSTFKKGPPSLLSILISKVFDSRRELVGNDPYKVYVFVGDKSGLASISLTHNGTAIPFKIEPEGAAKGEKEVDGDTETGLHTYILTASDPKGHKSTATLIVNVKVIPVGGVGGVAF